MSLLKWKELAKSKSKLGDKINYAHNVITAKHNIGQKTSQESFTKLFEPVTSKLDDVIDSNLDLRLPPRKKQPLKKKEVSIDYMPEVDPYEDMDVEGLLDFGDYVPPQQEKQLGPIPQIHVDTPDEPPEYDYDENVDYEIPNEELTMEKLNELGLDDYKIIDENLNIPERKHIGKIKYLNNKLKSARKEKQRLNGSKTAAKIKYKKNQNEAEFQEKIKNINDTNLILNEYINNIKEHIRMLETEHEGSGIKGRGKIKKAEKERNRIKGYKAHVAKKYNGGAISEAERQIMNKRLDNEIAVLNKYIKDHKKKLELEKKYKGRRKQRGGNVMFFNDPKQILKKSELIIGEIFAGNTSIDMRNTGVNILDTLLRMATINRPQYNKLYNLYFKV